MRQRSGPSSRKQIEASAAEAHPVADPARPVANPAHPVADVHAAPPLDASPDAIRRQAADAVLALGARLLDCALDFVPDDVLPLPGEPAALHAAARLHDADGVPIGRLRAMSLVPRPDFSPAEREVFAEVASSLSAGHAASTALGRFDHVTMLPNRQAFLADMARRPAGGGAGLLVLVTIADARQFNEILRALGHAYAEEFVAAGARRIRDTVPPDYRLYHVSVLSFAFVIPEETGAVPPSTILDLVSAMRAPIDCRDIPIASRTGIGMSPLPPQPTPAAESLRAALTAAQDSRARDLPYAFYDRRADEAHQRAFSLLSDLRTAVTRDDQLHLVYQPRICMRTERVVGAEALLRWRHPVYGDVSPGEFIPLAEATALVSPLTAWVVDAAVRQATAWRRSRPDLCVSVNVAPANLRERGFSERLSEQLARHDLPAEAIEIEITEGAATSGDSETLRQLDRMRALGHTLAIDDFGTGYSNLSYLTQLPTSVLKIDQSFVRPLEQDARRQLMVRSVIDLAHGLGYRVVAEGIETRIAYDMLSAWNCDEGQGYHMSRPLAVGAFEAFLGI